MINNLNLEALGQYVELVKEKPEEAITSLGVTATWKGGVNTEIVTDKKLIGSNENATRYTFNIGEPDQLLGDNKYPNPQDYILGGLAGCMMVGFVATATSKNIEIEHLELRVVGQLDLKGFLAIDPNATVGFENIQFNFYVKSNASQDVLDEIIAHVQKVSPGYRTMQDPIKISINKAL